MEKDQDTSFAKRNQERRFSKQKTVIILLELLKQGGQRAYAHLPYVQLYDIHKGQGLISKTPIPKNSLGYYGRYLQVIPQSIQCYPITNKIIKNIEEYGLALSKVLDNTIDITKYHSQDAYILGLGVLLGQLIYYGIVAPGDVHQAKKQIFSDRSP